MSIYQDALRSYLSNFNLDSQHKLINSLNQELLTIKAMINEAGEVTDSVVHKIIGIFKYIHVDDAAFYEKDKNKAHFNKMLDNLLLSLNEITIPPQELSSENTL